MLTVSHVNGKKYRYPTISINMTDEDVIQRVAGMLGVKVSYPGYGKRLNGERGKRIYRTQISGERASHFMRALLPYMGSRRSDKITSILLIWDAREDQNERRRAWSSAKAATRKRNTTGQLI